MSLIASCLLPDLSPSLLFPASPTNRLSIFSLSVSAPLIPCPSLFHPVSGSSPQSLSHLRDLFSTPTRSISPGHTWTWNRHEPSPSPFQQLFHSQPQHAGSLAGRGGSKRPEESCGNGVRGRMLCPRVSAHSGGEGEGGRRAQLCSWELEALAAQLHSSQPQAWLKSCCVC